MPHSYILILRPCLMCFKAPCIPKLTGFKFETGSVPIVSRYSNRDKNLGKYWYLKKTSASAWFLALSKIMCQDSYSIITSTDFYKKNRGRRISTSLRLVVPITLWDISVPTPAAASLSMSSLFSDSPHLPLWCRHGLDKESKVWGWKYSSQVLL